MLEKILNALKSLEHSKDEHWTTDGLPRIDVVKQLAGIQSITRDDIVAAAPTFNRSAAAAGTPLAAAPSAAPAPGANAAPPPPPAPTASPPPAAQPAKGNPKVIEERTAALADAQDELAEMDKWMEGAKVERAKRVAAVEAAQKALDAVQPVQTVTDAIQAYLKRQRESLALRGEQIAAASKFQKEHGFHLADLIPKRAKIDQAMARRSGYGNQRPGIK